MNQRLFVTGISTEIGKTVISAILTRALKADYWKPVQSGDLYHTDSMKVAEWAQHSQLQVFPERFRLHTPASPHYAAEIDKVTINLNDFELPETEKSLIVEGAGGLLVPLNDQDTMLDLMAHLNIPVVLVSRNYLGSINHTLLSIEALKNRNIPIAGIVFNGPPTPSTEEIILKMSGLKVLFHLPELEAINQATISQAALVKKEEIIQKLSEK